MSKHHSRKTNYSEKKPSVFERLGASIICRSWDENGSCVLGNACKLADTHFMVRPSLKLKAMKKGSSSKKTSHHRSETPPQPATSWEGWEDLEGADEKDLQKRRLQLQRELRLQLKREKELLKKKKKVKKSRRSQSSCSSSSSDSSSTTSSSTSSPPSRKRSGRKRKASPSSDSDDSSHKKKRKTVVASPKLKVLVKKKNELPRKAATLKKALKKSPSPTWERKISPKRKSPVRSKARVASPKHKARESSPRRVAKPKDRRVTPPRQVRQRSAERRRHHSPRRRGDVGRGGLEKGGKILPVKSSAYVKEMKESGRRKSVERVREDREKEREKEKRRREQKAREQHHHHQQQQQAERREREREAERIRREAEKERDEQLERSRDRQRDRDRLERSERDKIIKDSDHRKSDSRNDLPSLMDIKTDVPPPRESSRRSWEERRSRRTEEPFEIRRVPVDNVKVPEERRPRKVHEYGPETASWEGKEEFHEPSVGGEWGRDWKHQERYDPKWRGDSAVAGRERDNTWRERYPNRRSADWIGEPLPNEIPRVDDIVPVVVPRRPLEPTIADVVSADNIPGERPADLEEVLSDISDDADDILNQDDEPLPDVAEPPHPQQSAAYISQQGPEFFFDHRRPLLECLGERGLDFEEISDEDLEEEAKMSKGIMDVLGADWASLLKQTPVKTCKSEGAGTARRRWRIDSIISRIGFSVSLVGKEYADKYLNKIDEDCKEADQVAISSEENFAENAKSVKVKEEPLDNYEEKTQDGTTQETVKTEANDDTELSKVKSDCDSQGYETLVAKAEKERLMITLPGVYSALAELRGESVINRLLHPKHKRALSARTDLAVRRMLCGLSQKEPIQFSSPDEKLFESSVALFKAVVV